MLPFSFFLLLSVRKRRREATTWVVDVFPWDWVIWEAQGFNFIGRERREIVRRALEAMVWKREEKRKKCLSSTNQNKTKIRWTDTFYGIMTFAMRHDDYIFERSF